MRWMRQNARRLVKNLYEELVPVQQEEALIDLSPEIDVDPTPSETEPSIAQQINMISEPETPAPVTPAPRGRTLSKRRPRSITLRATRRSARHQVTQEAAPFAISPATGDTPPAKKTRSKQPTYRERSISTSDITSDNAVIALLKSPEASLIPAPTPSEHSTTIVLAEDNTLARSDRVMAQFLRDPAVLEADIIFIQEPWDNPFQDSTYHPAKATYQLLYPTRTDIGDERARVCLFISRRIDLNTWKHIPHSRDIQDLDLTDADGKRFRIFNIYNRPAEVGTGTLGLVSDLTTNNTNDYVLLLGDFNLHHPAWGGKNAARDTFSNQLLDLSDRRCLDLWLEPGTTTRDEAGAKTIINLLLDSQDLTPRLVTYLSDIPTTSLPRQLGFPDLAEHEVLRCIRKAPSDKAPGPDGIPNKVWHWLGEVPSFVKALTSVFNACIRLGHNPGYFQQSITVVFRKAAPRDYRVAKSYRPIALLNTLGKILEAAIATRIAYALEEYSLLPRGHLGGRKGISVDHLIQLLMDAIFDGWGRGQKVSMLLLDVAGAFDNVSHTRLLHSLKMARLGHFAGWLESFLSDRQTRLQLPGYLSGIISIPTGIPQGSPISPILFLLFNTPLIRALKINTVESMRIQLPLSGRTLAFGWIDDTCTIALSGSYAANQRLLEWALDKAAV
ncbi:reverse transcriptase [Aspergillus affinis]|uniref:reverse transcriptase n=1 Tax=Aspergillus affinis TaxID=1070780 RepID=UPI0022FE998C|nr:reverse transcriptase [Aspergillus affinis]KAI9039454.1 reverse transcriptase [Aspergillus affinis]